MPVKKKNEEIIDAVIYEKKPKKDKVNKEDKIIEIGNKGAKANFFPRFIAYIIDILLVSIISTGILLVLPKSNNYDKYLEEFKQIQFEYLEEKINYQEYSNRIKDVTYDLDYSNVFSIIIEVTLIILYFIVFQFYNKGQTLGKKLMKLRVVSVDDNQLSLNQMACRSLVINSILVNLLVLASLLFLGRNYYYYASYTLQYITIGIELIIVFMILFRRDGRGLHDVITKTKVIQEN